MHREWKRLPFGPETIHTLIRCLFLARGLMERAITRFEIPCLLVQSPRLRQARRRNRASRGV